MVKVSPYRTHVVKAGDTLSSIAQQYYGDFKQTAYLLSANGIQNPDLLKVGQVLLIPTLSSYASVQPTLTTNFAASPRAAADTLVSQLDTEGVPMPTVNTAVNPGANVPDPNTPAYTAGTGGDLGTVAVTATKVVPRWMTVVLLVAGAWVLFGDRR